MRLAGLIRLDSGRHVHSSDWIHTVRSFQNFTGSEEWIAELPRMTEDNIMKCVEAPYGNFAPLSARMVEGVSHWLPACSILGVLSIYGNN